MTPQSSFLYVAPVLPERMAALRALLLRMNRSLGVVDPENALIPFARFARLHSARVLILSDLAAADGAVYGLPTTGLPEYLALMGEIDGGEENFRAELIAFAEVGVRQLFSHCLGFESGGDLDGFLVRHSMQPAAAYVNWVGRTVQQEREEEQLRRALETHLQQPGQALEGRSPQQLRMALKRWAERQRRAGELRLTPPARTPWRWRVRNALNLLGVPLLLLAASPLLLLVLPVYLIQLRRWERNDAAVPQPLAPAHAKELASIENYDVTNQFSVFGSLKPGKLRLWSMRFFLLIVDYTARHLFNRGGLARVSTIHFARWVPFDGGQRMLFSSVYDGSLESYMDDFINKVGFGLNITFSNGIGYPRTRWLICDGCRDEQVFKRVLRRHQLPTQVWYNATPGLTAANKHRNSLIRKGLEAEVMSDDEVRDWIALL